MEKATGALGVGAAFAVAETIDRLQPDLFLEVGLGDAFLERVPELLAAAAPAILLHANPDRAGQKGAILEAHLPQNVALIAGFAVNFYNASSDDALPWSERVVKRLAQALGNLEVAFAGASLHGHAGFPEQIVKETAELTFDFKIPGRGGA